MQTNNAQDLINNLFRAHVRWNTDGATGNGDVTVANKNIDDCQQALTTALQGRDDLVLKLSTCIARYEAARRPIPTFKMLVELEKFLNTQVSVLNLARKISDQL